MKRSFLSGVMVAAALTGCVSHPVDLYPFKGPLSKKTPLPVIKATLTGVEWSRGTMSLTLPNGETCKGRWSTAAPLYSSASVGTLLGFYVRTMFGASMSAGIMPGSNIGHAFMSCSRGTTIESEFFVGKVVPTGSGISKDSAGNVYMMLF